MVKHQGLVGVLCCSLISLSGAAKQRVKLADVESLLLHDDEQTTFRRSSAVKQLSCRRGCNDFFPSSVLCRNMGTDGIDVQWKCEADLPEGYSFGRMDVSCEGYEYPDDPYILRGSCGLEFTLKNSGRGRNSHGRSGRAGSGSDYDGGRSGSDYDGGRSGSDYDGGYASDDYAKGGGGIGTWIMYGVIALIVYTLFKAWRRSSSGGGGGGDGGGGPPPYQPGFGSQSGPGGYGSGGYGSGGNGSAGRGGADCSSGAGRQGGGSGLGGGGFWSGLAAGGLMGHMFGGNRGYGNQYGYGGGYGYGNQGYGGFSNRRVHHPSSWGSGTRGGGFGSMGGGGTTRTTRRTGFAGTTRR